MGRAFTKDGDCSEAHLSHSAVASPFHGCHFAGGNIDVKRTEIPRSRPSILPGYGVVPGRYENAKAPFRVRGERCDRHTGLALNHKRAVGERPRSWHILFDRAGTNWSNGDYSFDPCS